MIASTGENPKRIALLAETGGAGGAERMMVHLGDELLRRGHEVIPVLPNGRNPWMVDQFSNRGCTPEMFTATPGSSDLKALAQMVGILRRRRVDVVHTHEFFTSVYGGAAARLLRKPQVITMHGGRYYASSKHRKTALRWVARGSRAVVGVSDATATELAEQLGIARARVQVVHNGVRPEAGHREPVRRELGVGDEETLVVAVGNLYPVKAHIVLLRALAGMREGLPPHHWRSPVGVVRRQPFAHSSRRVASPIAFISSGTALTLPTFWRPATCTRCRRCPRGFRWH
jgi:glycosyltransferase involved in cell wall biosynthesis